MHLEGPVTNKAFPLKERKNFREMKMYPVNLKRITLFSLVLKKGMGETSQ